MICKFCYLEHNSISISIFKVTTYHHHNPFVRRIIRDALLVKQGQDWSLVCGQI